VRRRYPTEALVFDTETETGPAQRLRFLVWRVYRDPVGHAPGHFCVEEGIAYPDDLPDRDPKGFRVLQRQAQRLRAEVAPGFGASATRGGLMFEPLSWWLDQRLYRYGYKHRNRCYVVGFNLPFDFGRLASYWTGARKYYRGGWSLGIWGAYNAKSEWHDTRYRPRLLMKAIDPRRTLFGWGSVKKADADEKGAAARFIDLRTLAFALTDVSHTLESACTAFGDHYEKTEVDYDQITPELVRYPTTTSSPSARPTSPTTTRTSASASTHSPTTVRSGTPSPTSSPPPSSEATSHRESSERSACTPTTSSRV
jgi:hypothetical protein